MELKVGELTFIIIQLNVIHLTEFTATNNLVAMVAVEHKQYKRRV
jgi:hypothetical protein